MKSNERDTAFSLFREGYSQKEIARLCGVNPATVTRWKKEDRWDQKRTESNLVITSSKEMVWDLIRYNLRVLTIQKEKQEEQFALTKDPKDLTLINKGDVDALAKLFACIKGPEKKFSDFVEMMKDFIRFIETQEGVEKAKELLPFSDKYLHNKRAELNE